MSSLPQSGVEALTDGRLTEYWGLTLDELIKTLSDGQIECLRLAAKGKSSKEIAKMTGFAPSTVDTYLSKAAIALGAGNRRQAARDFAKWDQHRLGKVGFLRSEANHHIAHQELDKDNPAAEAETKLRLFNYLILKILPPLGGRKNDLTRSERHSAVMRIALLSAIMLVATALVLSGGIRALR